MISIENIKDLIKNLEKEIPEYDFKIKDDMIHMRPKLTKATEELLKENIYLKKETHIKGVLDNYLGIKFIKD